MTASIDRAKQIGSWIAALVAVAIILSAAVWIISRFSPKPSTVPIETARKDEQKAAGVAQGVGDATATQNRDSTVHVDITTKEIRDAFDAPPPAPPAGVPVPAIPAAPVERVHDAINEGIARANRAADAADTSR